MGRKCNVLDCPSDSRRLEDNGVTFHKMPFHPDLRPKWIELCRIPEERQINKVIYVCSRHFRRTDFCNFKGTKYMLRQGALPSVFPWTKTLIPVQQNQKSVNFHEEADDEKNIQIKTEPEDIDEDIKPNIDILNEKIRVEATEEHEEIKCKTKKESSTSNKKEKLVIKTEPIAVIKAEPINFLPGTRIEANDFNDKWYPATILEVDYDENEVFVEFDKHLNRANEWIPMDSSRLRSYQPSTNLETYSVGEKVMATWIKSNHKFPATIQKILDTDTYEVLFDDGFSKILKHHKLDKIKDSSSVIQKGPIQHASPLFDPVVGSKEERRERKRKLNVAELFGKTATKKYKTEDIIKSEPEEDAQSQEEFRSTGSSSQCEGEEWTCRWLNGEPVGIESELEGIDGLRRSIIVADHRLPQGWEKHLLKRINGAYAGKWDTVIVNPNGKRFSNRQSVKTWMEENKLEYNLDRFDFCLHINRARKLGLYEITDPKSKKSNKSAEKVSKSHNNKVSTPKSGSDIHLPTTPEIAECEPEMDEDTSTYLKIIHEDGSYKCPIEGCGKIFRKENLAQMHVKHYHPESAKLLGSTPNVADLAYARTVGEHIDDIIPKARSIGSPLEKEKIIKTEITPKLKSTIKVLTPKASKIEEPDNKKSERILSPTSTPKPVTKDSEIIKLLNSEPKSKTIDSIFDTVPSKTVDTRHTEDLLNEPISADKYPEIKLKDLLHKAEPIPIPKKDEYRPTGIKTLLPVVRPPVEESLPDIDNPDVGLLKPTTLKVIEKAKQRKRQNSDNEIIKKRKHSLKYDTDEMSDFFEGDSHSLDSFKERKIVELPAVSVPIAESPQVIIEGGEVIRLVHMRSEEIINCTCGITEEDGLMIQCELCLCWQHAHCNNIQRENEVPEKYVCYICKNPQRMRASKKYIHDQEWLKQGILPAANYHAKDDKALKERFEKLRKSHELSGCLEELNEYIHNLKVKLNIANNKDHPKLYLWNKLWNKPISNENLNVMLSKAIDKRDTKEDHLNSSFSGSDHSYIKSSTFGDLALKTMLEPPKDLKLEQKNPLLEEDSKIRSESELISILEDNETPNDNKTQLEPAEYPKIDLNSMIASNLSEKIDEKDDEIVEDNKEAALSSITSGILSSGSLELALSQTDLVSSFAQLNDVEGTNEVSSVHIPQPEAAIDPADCRMNLLDHVKHFQKLVDERLNFIEAEISELEDQDSNLGLEENSDDFPRLKQTLQMLIKDLATMRQIAALSN